MQQNLILHARHMGLPYHVSIASDRTTRLCVATQLPQWHYACIQVYLNGQLLSCQREEGFVWPWYRALVAIHSLDRETAHAQACAMHKHTS